MADYDYDVIVIGSGFGGSVAALRLTEKGYRVAVVEAGRRFADDEFAKTSWDARRFLWAPALGCYGIQRIHLLKNVLLLQGAGVGGGSLVYGNTLYRPLKQFYTDPQWSGITDWESELAPYYDQASRMLGVVDNPTITPSDKVIQSVAATLGVADTFRPTPVAVHFGRPGEKSPDPYFGGAGPERTGCTECGSCQTGCRVGAKNTLVKNYLYLAERNGAKIIPLTTVDDLRPQAGGYRVEVHKTGKGSRKFRATLTAEKVVIAAGAWGTQNLLHRMRVNGSLPGISARLGVLTRTNSEAIVGATRTSVDPEVDYSTGTAITSSIHLDEHTHIEPVRYGRGSNAMGLLQTLYADGASDVPRVLQILREMVRHPARSARLLGAHRWSERTVILLVMQSLDNSITTYLKRGVLGRYKYTSKQGGSEPPTFIPGAYKASQLTAERIGGYPASTWTDAFNIPVTAHFIGGCVIGADAEHGVIDPYHRVYNYPGLSIVDGSAISANLGVNPSLTITAQAERAMAMWPNKGQRDTRPPQEEGYIPVAPVPPQSPAVPEHAPAALRLPAVAVPPREREP